MNVIMRCDGWWGIIYISTFFEVPYVIDSKGGEHSSISSTRRRGSQFLLMERRMEQGGGLHSSLYHSYIILKS